MSARTDPAIRAALAASSGRLYQPPPAGSAAIAREAASWLDNGLGDRPLPPLVIVIGMEHGDLLPVLARRGPECKLLVVEPDPVKARMCAARPDWVAMRTAGRLLHLVAPEFKGADVAWRLFPTAPEAHLLLVHPRLHPTPQLGAAAALVKKILFGVRANAEARRRFAPRYLTNVLKNVPAIAAGRDVRALTNAYAGRPALITAAGPSLDRVLDQIPSLASRALLIATDTTLRPLLHAGVQPHLAVGADPGQANARHFRELPPRGKTWLVAESALDSTAARAFADRTLWFRLANHHPWPWLRQHGVDIGLIEMWGSVLTAAFEVACLAGCDPIVIVGADLAYTGGRPYCRGTTYEFDWAHNVALGTGLDDTWRAQLSRTATPQVAGVRGEPVVTTSSLLSFRDWMVARASRSGRRVVNATDGGIFVGAGVEQRTLREAAAGWTEPVAEIDSIIGVPPDRPLALAVELERAHQSLHDIATAADPVPQWREFSGEGFDTVQVSQVLADSAAAMRTGAAPGAPDALVDWPALRSLEDGLGRLPEEIDRLRSALAGESIGTATATSERDAFLLDALRMLGRIVHALDARTEVAHVPGSPAHGPMAGRYLWPEDLRWAVVLYEGLLGAGLDATPSPVPETSFFGGAHARGRALETSVVSIADGAVARLAAEWMLAVTAQRDLSDADAVSAAARVMGVESCLLSSGSENVSTHHIRLSMTSRDGRSAETLTLPLPVGLDPLTRVATGALRSPRHDRMALLQTNTSVMTASVDLVPALPGSGSTQSLGRHTPIVLTDRQLPRSLVAYATTDGAVCVTPYGSETTLLDGAGQRTRHMAWPHPIVGAAPFGEGGAVAWSNGMIDGRAEQAYVMYRRSASDDVTTEPIPVRPTLGAWWQGRLYWNCYPTPSSSWFGLASWAPGEEVRLETPDVTLFGLLAGTEGLDLHPARFTPGIGFARELATAGLRRREDGTSIEFALGPEGPCSMRHTSNGWTAEAYPQTHTILLTPAVGRPMSMLCHAPFRLAWIDGHLLVSTLERDLLLFSDLQSTLNGTARRLDPAEPSR